jgi:hypothetical protein
MLIGMLWFDNDPKADLKTKVQRATEYYQKKYGKPANLVFINPSQLEDVKVPGVEIRVNRSVLPSHFWVGVNQ